MTNKNQNSQKDQLEKDSDKPQSGNNYHAGLWRYSISFSDFQKRFLILSAIVPLAIFLLQIGNLVFVILRPPPPLPGGIPQQMTFSMIIDISTPTIVMTIMSIFGMINFIFLLGWKKKVTRYNNQKQSFKKMIENPSNEIDDVQFVSFANLSYENLKHMKRMKTFSYITNIASVLYIWWIIRGFLFQIGVLIPKIPVHEPPLVLHIFNLIAQIGLIVYVFIQWRFFQKWNKKLTRIEIFEKQIFDELNL